MKYLDEYRDPKLAKKYLDEIKKITSKRWKIMEVCGGQTHSLVKYGILDLLPKEIEMIHGPGCPVCVTPINLIDKAIILSKNINVILCSFGDMLRVPGTENNLLEMKSKGADIRILYSPLEAVEIAKQNTDKEVVFFGVGFETTAPANALTILKAENEGVKNFSLLTAHVLVPPAISAIMEDKYTKVDAFLAAGHVCTIMGMWEYEPLIEKYNVPIVVTGFEPIDLLQGILMTVRQLEKGQHFLENQYTRYVSFKGNEPAQNIISKVFEIGNREWRGIGEIPNSGYHIREEFKSFDAEKKFKFSEKIDYHDNGCISGDIMKGIKKPFDCPYFGKECNQQNPMGAPMVSSEGACAAYYQFAEV